MRNNNIYANPYVEQHIYMYLQCIPFNIFVTSSTNLYCCQSNSDGFFSLFSHLLNHFVTFFSSNFRLLMIRLCIVCSCIVCTYEVSYLISWSFHSNIQIQIFYSFSVSSAYTLVYTMCMLQDIRAWWG